MKKQYLKNREVCKITFQIKDNVNGVENARIIGDFNNWDIQSEPMKKLKTGGFSQTINLDAGKSYQFKYLINDSQWINEPEADQLVPNRMGEGEFNSLIVL